MKRLLPVVAALAMLVVGRAEAATADTSQLTVKAAVAPTCSFSATNYDMIMGTYDAAVGLSFSAPVTFSCTLGTAPAFAIGAGQNDDAGGQKYLKRVAGVELLPYTISATVPSARAADGSQTVTVTADILAGEWNFPSGNYQDVVVIEVQL